MISYINLKNNDKNNNAELNVQYHNLYDFLSYHRRNKIVEILGEESPMFRIHQSSAPITGKKKKPLFRNIYIFLSKSVLLKSAKGSNPST